MTVHVLDDKITSFKNSIDRIVDVLQNTDEEKLYIQPSEKEWSAMQIVSHVLEAVDFWVADLEALLIVPGAKWGRNHEHVRRLAAVSDTVVSQLKREEAIEKLKKLVPKVEQALSKVKEEDLEKTAPSYNPNFDGKPLSFLIDHLIVGHVESHYGQLVRHLEKVK
ncbi:DinB family protein [Ureibacillus sp. FSL K6-8385]|uniref:DinB family protein n=1 Tax=Ureibacillus terrenus TaxID=118246 RepID=A0A540V5N0_9BACL|nr:DinB family protein [Ureibacillus terrenus]MED3661271.1 DinB family protein [Ureibacillus terrenus]MED3764254.1 DinB family protein [Ureibacillus terrenus]TQE92059.1 DinB family protein [Ureibacillus terrenus]